MQKIIKRFFTIFVCVCITTHAFLMYAPTFIIHLFSFLERACFGFSYKLHFRKEKSYVCLLIRFIFFNFFCYNLVKNWTIVTKNKYFIKYEVLYYVFKTVVVSCMVSTQTCQMFNVGIIYYATKWTIIVGFKVNERKQKKKFSQKHSVVLNDSC